jgi:hypothetical protein
MIALSIQDKFDGSTKVQDLREAIGQEFSDNRSSTLRSKLVSVSADGNTCVVKEVASPYKSGNQSPKPGTSKQPSWLTWNAMFF